MSRQKPKPAICKEHRDLEKRIHDDLNGKKYCSWAKHNVPYIHGQLDVYAKQCNRYVYYEIKRSYTPASLARAKNQGNRWLTYQMVNHPYNTSYVVLVTRTKMQIIGKYHPKWKSLSKRR